MTTKHFCLPTTAPVLEVFLTQGTLAFEAITVAGQ